MNWDQIEGNWKQLKGQAKQKWAKLTDSDWNMLTAKKTNSLAVCRNAMATIASRLSAKSTNGVAESIMSTVTRR